MLRTCVYKKQGDWCSLEIFTTELRYVNPHILGNNNKNIFLFRVPAGLGCFWILGNVGLRSVFLNNNRPFNLQLDFRKSRSWKIKVYFKPLKNFRSYKKTIFICTINLKKIQVTHRKKSKCAGSEIFLSSETDLDFSNLYFQKSSCRLKSRI